MCSRAFAAAPPARWFRPPPARPPQVDRLASRRILPLVMRPTSSRSSTRRVSCVDLAPITSRRGAAPRTRSSRPCMIATAFEIGASGLRSSWASIARNVVMRRPFVLQRADAALLGQVARHLGEAAMRLPLGIVQCGDHDAGPEARCRPCARASPRPRSARRASAICSSSLGPPCGADVGRIEDREMPADDLVGLVALDAAARPGSSSPTWPSGSSMKIA